MFGAGGVVAFYGAGCLLACAIIAISGVVAAWLAALIVGAALLAAAGCAALVRKRRLKTVTPPVPEATVANVKADVDEIKDELKNRTDDRPRNPAGDRTEPGATRSGSSGPPCRAYARSSDVTWTTRA